MHNNGNPEAAKKQEQSTVVERVNEVTQSQPPQSTHHVEVSKVVEEQSQVVSNDEVYSKVDADHSPSSKLDLNKESTHAEVTEQEQSTAV